MHPGIYQVTATAKQMPGIPNAPSASPAWPSPHTRGGPCFQAPDSLTCSKHASSMYVLHAPTASAPLLYQRRFWGGKYVERRGGTEYGDTQVTQGFPAACHFSCQDCSSSQPLQRVAAPPPLLREVSSSRLPRLPRHFLVTDAGLGHLVSTAAICGNRETDGEEKQPVSAWAARGSTRRGRRQHRCAFRCFCDHRACGTAEREDLWIGKRDGHCPSPPPGTPRVVEPAQSPEPLRLHVQAMDSRRRHPASCVS